MASLYRGPTRIPKRQPGTRPAELSLNLLLTTLAVQAAAAPFEPTDWTRTFYRRALVGDTVQNLLNSLLPTTLAPFEPQDYSINRRANIRQSEATQNLLPTLLPTTERPLIVKNYDAARRAQIRQSEATFNLLPTLLPTTLAPLNVADEIRTRRMQVRGTEFTQNTSNALPEIFKPKPFRQIDWPPIPRAPRQLADAVQNLLTTTLAQAQASPFIPIDWARTKYKLGLQGEAVQNILTTMLAAPAVEYVLRTPIRAGRTRDVAARPQEQFVNLLLTTLAQAQATPFSPIDWTRTLYKASKNTDAVQTLLNTLLPTTLRPFVPKDYSTNQRADIRPSEATQNLLPTLLPTTLTPLTTKQDERTPAKPVRQVEHTTSLLPRFARPFAPADWTVVPSARRRNIEAAQNLLATTLAQAAAAPFTPTDWPRLSRLSPRLAEATRNLLTTTLAEPYIVNPPTLAGRIRKAATLVQESSLNLLLTTLAQVQATPFSPVDWTRASTRSTRQTDAVQDLLGTLLPTTLAPRNIADEARPRRTLVRGTEFTQNLSNSLPQLFKQRPLVTYEWPAPPRLRGRVAEAVQNLLTSTLANKYTVNGPTVAGVTRRLRQQPNTDIPNLLLTTLAQVQAAPFNQTDWTRTTYRVTRKIDAVQSLINTLLAEPYLVNPPTQTGRLRAVAQRKQDTTLNLLLTTLAQVQANPFRNADWTRTTAHTTRQADAVQNLLNTLLAAPYQFNPPTVTGRQRTIAPPKPEISTNLLLTTLTPTTPFVSQDWLRPARANRATEAIAPQQNILPGLLQQTAAPIASYDWQQPYRTIQRNHRPEIYVNTLKMLSTPIPNQDRLFIDVDTGEWYMRMSPTGKHIVRLT